MFNKNKYVNNAVVHGIKPEHYHNGAHNHAKAFWFYMVIAAVVWYFFSWMWALLPTLAALFVGRESIRSTSIAVGIEDALNNVEDYVKILRAYGDILETSTNGPGTVADVKALPFSKHEIKDAIIRGLQNSPDENTKNILINGYLFLADWQEDVGDEMIRYNSVISDPNTNMEDVINDLQAQNNLKKDWLSIVTLEQETLKKELMELGFLHR